MKYAQFSFSIVKHESGSTKGIKGASGIDFLTVLNISDIIKYSYYTLYFSSTVS